ncbi:trimethylamine--corrinoid methyltransferase [Deltaproteobacteria bacterium Smac51]|nr:trimethylamine--corrinoid methyltransferase [Deltaproteobacteria bacterium Smac51]
MQFFEIFSQGDLEAIHENVLDILEKTGIVFLYEPALDIFRKAGCRVDGNRVYFPRKLVEEQRRLAPSSFTVYGRTRERDVVFDRDSFVTIPCYGSPYVHHLGEERREGTRDDFIKFTKLTQDSPHLDVASAVPCEMADLPLETRDKEYIRTILELCEKPFVVSKTAGVVKSAFELSSILYGSPEEMKEKPRFLTIVDSLPPLAYDETMTEMLMFCSEYGIPQRIGGLGQSGLTTPVTWPGLLCQMMAESLAGIVLSQLIRPGTPVLINNSSSATDMKTLGLSVGAPESALNCIGTAQMARFYGLPCRSGGAISDSKIVDAQAGAETMMNLMTSAMSGANFILHACGILEAYMVSSLEKFVVDEECCAMVRRILRGAEVNEDTLARQAIDDVGPKGNYLTHKHTTKRYKGLFQPALFNRESYGRWVSGGEKDCAQAARELWQKRIEKFEVPSLGADDLKKLSDYVNS